MGFRQEHLVGGAGKNDCTLDSSVPKAVGWASLEDAEVAMCLGPETRRRQLEQQE